MGYYTVFRKKTPTHFPPRYKRKRECVFLCDVQTKETSTRDSRFLLYLGGKCLNLYKIFRVCLQVIRHSTEVKIKYSLLLLTHKHFVKCLFSIVKPIILQSKHVKMTSELRHW